MNAKSIDLYNTGSEHPNAADMEQGELSRHQRTTIIVPAHHDGINFQPFAGRIGGNQLFTSVDSAITSKTPDAKVTATWPEILDLRGFTSWALWQTAIIEGVGMLLQVYMSRLVGFSVVPLVDATSVGAVLPVTYAAVFQFIMITLFIFTLGPVTGAHLNPLITMATFLTRLTSLPRAVLYIVFQCIGSVCAAYLLRVSLGAKPEDLVLAPGCYIDPALVTPGEAFALETVGSSFLVFLAFGLGLDPRNSNAFGPSLGPFLIGLASGFSLFAGGAVRKGYLGFSSNPARCLGLMAAANRFTYHHIHWTGDITVAM